jgi:F-type H+-transporting ATPase subunit delta
LIGEAIAAPLSFSGIRRKTSQVPSKTQGTTGLAGRYAAALFELADEAKRLDVVADDLRFLSRMIEENSELVRLIYSPILSRDAQGNALAAIMEKAGISELTRQFVGLVGANRRLFVLADMMRAYLAALALQRGEVTAEVVSAKALTEKQTHALVDGLKRAVGAAVSLDSRIDPGLLGGLVVKLGSRMVDSSLRTKLQRLRLAMKGVG